MQYMKLSPIEREALMGSLVTMKSYLREAFQALRPEEMLMAGPDGAFSPVEQVWHLADLEREGFGRRIERLRTEPNPQLPDFDGTRIAQERNYRSLPLEAGLQAFEAARDANLAALRAVPDPDWTRRGSQEGVGEVSLCDMPSFLHQHDQAHIAEIEQWKASRRPRPE
jgi:hypothetical protein